MTEFTSASYDSLQVGDHGLRLSGGNPVRGIVRFNNNTNRFEGFTGENDALGNTWHTLNREMASSTVLGSIKIGSNLNIQSDGVTSSIAEGISRFNQNVITVVYCFLIV